MTGADNSNNLKESIVSRRRILLAILGGGIGIGSAKLLFSTSDSDDKYRTPEKHTTIVHTSENISKVISEAEQGEILRLENGTHKAGQSFTMRTDGVTVVIPSEATLKAPDGIKEEERFIRVEADGITFQGNGTIDGNLKNSEGATSGLGHEHILQIGNSSEPPVSNFTLDGPTLNRAPGGDCLYITNTTDSRFLNFVANGGYRNSISVISAKNLYFNNFKAVNARGRPPESGLGFEPNAPGESLNSIKISDGIMSNNERFGTYLNNQNTTRSLGEDVIDIEYQNCVFAENNFSGSDNTRAKGVDRLQFNSCDSNNNLVSGWSFGGIQKARLDDCIAWNNGNNDRERGDYSGVYLLPDQADNSTAPVVVLNGFEAIDTQWTKTQQHPGRVDTGMLRVRDSRIGPHAASKDGYRAHGSDSEIAYSEVYVASDDAPAYSTDGGQISHITQNHRSK